MEKVPELSADIKVLEEHDLSDYVINCMPGVFFLQTADGKYLRWNDNFEVVSGYSKDEILNINAFDFFEGKNKEDVAQKINEAFKTGKASIETTIIRKSGERVPYYFVGCGIIYNGQACIIGSGADITEKKKAEDVLLKSQAELSAIFNNTDTSYILLDSDFNVLTLNTIAAEKSKLFFGNSVKAGEKFIDKIPDARKEIARANFLRVLQGETIAYEADYSIYDIGANYFSVKLHPIKKATGEIYGICFSSVDITDRKLAELRVAKSEEKYHSLFEQATDAIFLCDFEARLIDVNDAMCNLLGYTKEELLAMSAGQLVEPEDLKKNPIPFDRLINGEHMLNKRKVVRKDGGLLDFEVNIKRLGDNMIMAIARDVTQMRKVQQQVEISEATLRGAFENSAIGMGLTGLDGRWLRVNKELCKMLGYSRDELLQLTFQHITHPDDLAKDVNALHQLIKGEINTYRSEKRYIHKDGSIIWISLNVALVKDAEGKPLYCVTQVEDITGKKNADARLKESEEQLRLFVQHSPAAIAMLDTDLRYILVSKRWLSDYGLGDIDIIGKTHYEVFPDIPDEWKQIHQRCLTGVVEKREEDPFYREDGSVAWIKWEIQPWYKANGAIGGIIMFTEVITDRKTAEMQREQITNDLIQRNKDLEQFAYIISHNLRAPVANIMGFSEVLSEDIVDAETQKLYLGELNNSVSKLDDVIRDLNNILQVRREVSEVKEKVSFTKIVHNVEVSIKNMIANENARIETDFIAVDEIATLKSYIHSIFYNLISNSIKYRKPDVAPVISIKSRKEGKKVILEFADNGLGIDMDKKGDQVFGLYKRFHTNLAEGKGIGLYMTKTQIETLGGKITVDSKVGEGTRFTIELPA